MNWFSNQSVTGILGSFLGKLRPILTFCIADSSEHGLGRPTNPNKARTAKASCIISLCENREEQTHAGYSPLNQMVTAVLTLLLGKFVSTAHFSPARIGERVRNPITDSGSPTRQVCQSRRWANSTEAAMSFSFISMITREIHPIADLGFEKGSFVESGHGRNCERSDFLIAALMPNRWLRAHPL